MESGNFHAAGFRLGADSSCGVILANPPGSKDSKGNWALAGARGVLFYPVHVVIWVWIVN